MHKSSSNCTETFYVTPVSQLASLPITIITLIMIGNYSIHIVLLGYLPYKEVFTLLVQHVVVTIKDQHYIKSVALLPSNPEFVFKLFINNLLKIGSFLGNLWQHLRNIVLYLKSFSHGSTEGNSIKQAPCQHKCLLLSPNQKLATCV